MATSATNSYTGKGIAESFEDIIFDISPEDTPLLSMAKRMSAGQTYHQWQTDALAAAATNASVEGDDASFATLAATTNNLTASFDMSLTWGHGVPTTTGTTTVLTDINKLKE